MSDGSFTFKIRTQFSFKVNDRKLSRILYDLTKENINITGYLQTKLLENHNIYKEYNENFNYNIVRLVVSNYDTGNSRDVIRTRDLLTCLGIDFEEKPVIQVVQLSSGTPGVFNTAFGALWCRVTVNAMYFGEENAFFIDVSNICKALLILSKA